MPLYTDSNEIYVDGDDDHHHQNDDDDPPNRHSTTISTSSTMPTTTSTTSTFDTNPADVENQQQQRQQSDTTITTATANYTMGNDALLGPYHDVDAVPSILVMNNPTVAFTTTTNTTSTSTTTAAAATNTTEEKEDTALQSPPPPLPPQAPRSGGILRSSSVRRMPFVSSVSSSAPHSSAVLPPPLPQKRLSFLKRSGTETSRTHSFRRLNSSNHSTNNNNNNNHHSQNQPTSSNIAGALDRSEGSMRSSAGSVHSTGTNQSHMSSHHTFSIKGSFFPGRSSTSSRSTKRPSSALSTNSGVSSGSGGATTGGGMGETVGFGLTTAPSRRYKVGENVLIQPIFDPTDTTSLSIQYQFVSLVNKYGFVMDDPRCQSEEEYHGPYQYVLASVQQIHFEEIHPYYTVQRYDMMSNMSTPTATTTTNINTTTTTLSNSTTGNAGSSTSTSGTVPPQRVDDYQMHPLLTQRHEMAALQAATHTRTRLQQALDQGILILAAVPNHNNNNDHNDNNNNNTSSSSGNENNREVPSPRLQFQYHPEKINPSSTGGPDHYHHHTHTHHHPHHPHNTNLPYRTNRGSRHSNLGHHLQWYHYLLFMIQLPFFCMVDAIYYVWNHLLVPSALACVRFLRTQANLFLYGHEPYLCRIRLTMLNFVVLCSTWFMFSDQLRLFFFSHSADNVLAMINFGVWVVLIFELFCEVFIRPDGYQGLLISDKAFTPTTVRYINTIHFVVEILALCVFVPEFFCIFTNYSCSERFPFSFYNAVLYGVIGPSYTNVFLGHAYIALVRIRIFCMVRHWKNMWVTRTFINMTWRSNKSTILSNIIPPAVHRGSRVITTLNNPRNSMDATALKSSGPDKSHNTDRKLTNASNIGTALMVINSYRSLAIVCVIAGLFPIIFSFLSVIINPLTYQLTRQLQATNIVAADTSNATCRFLDTSVKSWMIAVNIRGGKYDNYLLTLDIQPRRCNYSENYFINVDTCRGLTTIPEPAIPICMEWDKYDNVELTTPEIADAANIRRGSIMELEYTNVGNFTVVQEDGSTVEKSNTSFSVTARFDHSLTIQIA